jgi:hypothetical protein
MYIAMKGKRREGSRGHSFKTDADICGTHKGYKALLVELEGDNEQILEDEYSDRVRDPGSRYGWNPIPTEYKGQMRLSAREILMLFDDLVSGLALDASFKRVARKLSQEIRQSVYPQKHTKNRGQRKSDVTQVAAV